MTDHQLQSTIDTALDELAEAKPGPHFVPRLRAHVEQSRRTMVPVRRVQLAFAVGVALILGLVVGGRVRHDAAASVARVGEDVALAPMPVPDVPAHPALPAPPAREAAAANGRLKGLSYELSRARVRDVRDMPDVPEVIVPPDQREAVGRLFAALNAGQLEALSMMRSVNSGSAGDTALTVAPIRIDPVVVSPVFDK